MSIFGSIWADVKYGFKMGNMVRKLILVNVIVFVLTLLITLGCNIATAGRDESGIWVWKIIKHFAMPADWRELWKVWSPITSIFLHQGLWHLLGNMIWLSLFGTIVGDLIGDRRVLPIYLLGGLAGCLLYFISAQFFPFAIGGHALGASAAVMAFGGVALMLNPEYRVGLLFLGEVKIKYIVLFMLLLDLVSISERSNTGGHAAHIGGFLFGFMYVYALRDRRDWSDPVNNILDRINGFFENLTNRPKPTMRVTYQRKEQTNPKTRSGATQADHKTDLSHQERIDQILDKIKQNGLDSLTAEEKDYLYEASKK
jgi:membrane associated rhomboid family serine protease